MTKTEELIAELRGPGSAEAPTLDAAMREITRLRGLCIKAADEIEKLRASQ